MLVECDEIIKSSISEKILEKNNDFKDSTDIINRIPRKYVLDVICKFIKLNTSNSKSKKTNKEWLFLHVNPLEINNIFLQNHIRNERLIFINLILSKMEYISEYDYSFIFNGESFEYIFIYNKNLICTSTDVINEMEYLIKILTMEPLLSSKYKDDNLIIEEKKGILVTFKAHQKINFSNLKNGKKKLFCNIM